VDPLRTYCNIRCSPVITQENRHEFLVAATLLILLETSQQTVQLFDGFVWMGEGNGVEGVARSAIRLDGKGIDILIANHHRRICMPLQVKVELEEVAAFSRKYPAIPVITTEKWDRTNTSLEHAQEELKPRLEKILLTAPGKSWHTDHYDFYEKFASALIERGF